MMLRNTTLTGPGPEPLKFLSKGHQRVMAGFITTKIGELESMDHLKNNSMRPQIR